jgi:hypothetical protein
MPNMHQCAQGFANDDARRLARARECACVRACVCSCVAVVVMVWAWVFVCYPRLPAACVKRDNRARVDARTGSRRSSAPCPGAGAVPRPGGSCLFSPSARGGSGVIVAYVSQARSSVKPDRLRDCE